MFLIGLPNADVAFPIGLFKERNILTLKADASPIGIGTVTTEWLHGCFVPVNLLRLNGVVHNKRNFDF